MMDLINPESNNTGYDWRCVSAQRQYYIWAKTLIFKHNTKIKPIHIMESDSFKIILGPNEFIGFTFSLVEEYMDQRE